MPVCVLWTSVCNTSQTISTKWLHVWSLSKSSVRCCFIQSCKGSHVLSNGNFPHPSHVLSFSPPSVFCSSKHQVVSGLNFTSIYIRISTIELYIFINNYIKKTNGMILMNKRSGKNTKEEHVPHAHIVSSTCGNVVILPVFGLNAGLACTRSSMRRLGREWLRDTWHTKGLHQPLLELPLTRSLQLTPTNTVIM